MTNKTYCQYVLGDVTQTFHERPAQTDFVAPMVNHVRVWLYRYSSDSVVGRQYANGRRDVGIAVAYYTDATVSFITTFKEGALAFSEPRSAADDEERVNSWQDAILCAIHEDSDAGRTPEDMQHFAQQLQWITGLDLTPEESQDRALCGYYVDRVHVRACLVHQAKPTLLRALNACYTHVHIASIFVAQGELIQTHGDETLTTLDMPENPTPSRLMTYQEFNDATYVDRKYLLQGDVWKDVEEL